MARRYLFSCASYQKEYRRILLCYSCKRVSLDVDVRLHRRASFRGKRKVSEYLANEHEVLIRREVLALVHCSRVLQIEYGAKVSPDSAFSAPRENKWTSVHVWKCTGVRPVCVLKIQFYVRGNGKCSHRNLSNMSLIVPKEISKQIHTVGGWKNLSKPFNFLLHTSGL